MTGGTLFIELGKSTDEGIKIVEKAISVEDFFLKYLGFEQMPPLDFQCRIIRPYAVYRTPFFDMVTFEVDFAKAGDPPKIGLMSRHFEKRGSAAIVRVTDAYGKQFFVFVQQERFLFGILTETVRGFDAVVKELSEELDLSEQPQPILIGTTRINTGISMTKSPGGDVPLYLVDLKTKPKIGKGELTEKLKNAILLTSDEIREKNLSGEITDPFFSRAYLLLLQKEGSELLGGAITIYP